MATEDKSYVGIAPCGCIRMCCVDSQHRKKQTADFCAHVIKEGLTLERMNVEEVRAAKWGCEQCDRWVQEQLQTTLDLATATTETNHVTL